MGVGLFEELAPVEPAKRCRDCHQVRNLSEFLEVARTTDGRGSHCRLCHRVRTFNDRYQHHLVRPFTTAELERMLAEQGGVCAICKDPDRSEKGYGLTVDHDHTTGRIRQLICGQCNRGIGFAKDDPALLRAWAEYVEQHRMRA